MGGNKDVTMGLNNVNQFRYMVTYTSAENKISLFSEDNQFVGDYYIKIIGKFTGTSV